MPSFSSSNGASSILLVEDSMDSEDVPHTQYNSETESAPSGM